VPERLRSLAPLLVAVAVVVAGSAYVATRLLGDTADSGPPSGFVGAGGAVTESATSTPAMSATQEPLVPSTPSAMPSPTAAPTATPTATAQADPFAGGFAAEVEACRSLQGDRCRGSLKDVRSGGSFTALMRFENISAGDAVAITLAGPATYGGAPYAMQGGGDGYYYSEFSLGGAPGGDYQLIATRNGSEVASTTIRVR
jgi:hypothetical protein